MNCLIAGASGLVGKNLMELLLMDGAINSVNVLSRSPLNNNQTKVKKLIISFDKIDSINLPQADVAFCCLGTTIKKAGSEEAFYTVDHDYIVNYAKACEKAGIKTFIVVSAQGADSSSVIFYNKVKGQTEEDLKKIKFPNLFILRPSLLMGERSESRPTEKLAQKVSHFLSPFMIGPLKKIRPVKASCVAFKMKDLIYDTGFKIISNEEI